MNKTRTMTARERELLRRSILLGAGALFFFLLAAARAAAGDFYGEADPWAFPEDDEYDVMSADDHIMASRLRRRVVGSRPVYHRRKASRVHDSVTIVINENTTSEITSANDLSRDTTNNMTLTSWLTPKLSGGLGTTQQGAAAGGNTPTIQYANSRAHQSDSTIERGQTFTTTLTGEVIAVHPNGYLVIEARKSVSVNGETQTVTVTGTVNPAHMDSNSSLQAQFLMDMAVEYSGKGPMSRMDRRGWASQIIDFLNPF